MKLTKKIVLLIILICLLFSVLYFILFRVVLTTPIQEQKQLRAKQLVASTRSVFHNESLRIITLCEDWAMWDTMYTFTSSPSEQVLKDLSPLTMLQGADLNLLLILDKDKKILAFEGYDNLNKKKLTFKALTERNGDLWKYITLSFTEDNSLGQLISTEHGALLTISSPVLHSDDSGPKNGRVVMGRLINVSIEKKIEEAIGEETQLLFNGKIPGSFSFVEEDRHMVIRFFETDAWQQRIFGVRINAGKRLFEILESATGIFFILLIAGFVLFGILFYFVIHHMIVRRVTGISGKTDQIVSFDDLSLRVNEEYCDEVTRLSQNINKMLMRLETENSRRQEIERTLMLNDKLIFLGKVTSRIAHEVNNPLFAINNGFELIKQHLPTDNQKISKVSKMIESEIRRVRTITRDMHGHTIRQMETFSSASLTQIIFAAINVVTWSKQIRETVIRFNSDGPPFPLYCNPDTLQQVFMNLIFNAIDAMQGKGEVVISVSPEESSYRIMVSDCGPGLNPEFKKKIFEAYTTAKPGRGTGLGLYISKNIILNHKGSIILDEEYTGGTRFVIKIPVVGK